MIRCRIAAAASALNRHTATGAHERVAIEVQARKLDLTNVNAFHQRILFPTSIKPIGGIVAT
jgi:hypothetical protein